MNATLLQQQATRGTLHSEPAIIWKGSPNFWPRRRGYQPLAIVVHTTSGTLAAADSWFANPSSQVSAHFGVGLDGVIHQYVGSADAAWSNGVLEAGHTWPGTPGVNPNLETISIETEDLGRATRPVSEEQLLAVLSLGRLMQRRHPSIRYLARHATISPKSRPNCPGPRWTASGRFAALAAELGLEAI